MMYKSMLPCAALSMFMISAAFFGCTQSPSAPKAKSDDAQAQANAEDAEAKVTTNLAQLKEEDRRTAQAQKFCVVEHDNRLGAMGVPVKLTIEGQPVFLCCPECKDEALKDPKATLAKLAELKQANSSSK